MDTLLGVSADAAKLAARLSPALGAGEHPLVLASSPAANGRLTNGAPDIYLTRLSQGAAR